MPSSLLHFPSEAKWEPEKGRRKKRRKLGWFLASARVWRFLVKPSLDPQENAQICVGKDTDINKAFMSARHVLRCIHIPQSSFRAVWEAKDWLWKFLDHLTNYRFFFHHLCSTPSSPKARHCAMYTLDYKRERSHSTLISRSLYR